MTNYDTTKERFHIYTPGDDTICARELSETITELNFQVDYLAISGARHVTENGTAAYERSILLKSGDEASMRLVHAIDDPQILEIAADLKAYAEGWHQTIMKAAQQGEWSMLSIPHRMPVFDQTDDVYLKLQPVIDWFRNTGNSAFAEVFETKRKLSSRTEKPSKSKDEKAAKPKLTASKIKAPAPSTASVDASASVTKPLTRLAFDSLPDGAFVRQNQLIASKPGEPSVLPFSAATLWRKEGKGEFPKSVKLSEQITAWSVKEIRQWLAEKSVR